MAIAFLEDFDLATRPKDPEPPAPQELAGYDSGFRDGLAACQSNQANLTQDLVQAISEMTFGFSEARQQVLGQLTPLFKELAQAVLPALAKEGFSTHLVEVLSAAAKSDVERPMHLSVHPHKLDAIRTLLDDHAHLQVCATADAALSLNAATVSCGDGGTVLDLDAMVQALADTLQAIEPTPKEVLPHG